MKDHGILLIAAILAAVLAIGIGVRITMQRNSFDHVVQEALETSEGYDAKFIEMVNKLEDELAERASFGYKGQKDPMTGKVRAVVLQNIPVRRPRKAQTTTQTSEVVVAPEQEFDPVKLTAIIYDDDKKVFTAIVMDDERSYSVEVGDRVKDRTITKISNDVLFMESPTAIYRYDVYGNSAMKKKE